MFEYFTANDVSCQRKIKACAVILVDPFISGAKGPEWESAE
jgi:hypothetical protein